MARSGGIAQGAGEICVRVTYCRLIRWHFTAKNKIEKILSDKGTICSNASNHDSPALRVGTELGGWENKI
jgi:hypothetical protein